jgi:hypothetical protein
MLLIFTFSAAFCSRFADFSSVFAPFLGSTSAGLSRIYFAHFSSFFDHSFYPARNSGVFSAVVALIFHVSFGGIL